MLLGNTRQGTFNARGIRSSLRNNLVQATRPHDLPTSPPHMWYLRGMFMSPGGSFQCFHQPRAQVDHTCMRQKSDQSCILTEPRSLGRSCGTCWLHQRKSTDIGITALSCAGDNSFSGIDGNTTVMRVISNGRKKKHDSSPSITKHPL